MRQSKNAVLRNARTTGTLLAMAGEKQAFLTPRRFAACAVLWSASLAIAPLQAQKDPGPRGGAAGAGGPVAGLTANEGNFFADGQTRFQEVEGISNGLGPRFNLNSCSGCHAQPAVGGSSPASNPQVAGNVAPAWQVFPLVALGLISPSGPVREIRFTSDGGVHDLFTIAGTSGAPPGCRISQPNFRANLSNIIFRVPTPTFGAGLIEAIPDATILANVGVPKPFGIAGHENRNGNDGSVTRFGWKAQNKSLAIFSGEAYNVEMGISNELFSDERGEGGMPDPTSCYATTSPNDHTNYEVTTPTGVPSDVIAFADFMRFLDQPTPACAVGSTCAASVNRGSALFDGAGCAVCHIRTMQTGSFATAALRNQAANLFSDLLVHHMGALADRISQGLAGPDEFRTAPLWGLGQRIFFLHDGRDNDLLMTIEDHARGGRDPNSEANTVVQNFNGLTTQQKQDLLNFLRTL
jgi:CxxC motif-containing protein (DUF1111 family)